MKKKTIETKESIEQKLDRIINILEKPIYQSPSPTTTPWYPTMPCMGGYYCPRCLIWIQGHQAHACYNIYQGPTCGGLLGNQNGMQLNNPSHLSLMQTFGDIDKLGE